VWVLSPIWSETVDAHGVRYPKRLYLGCGGAGDECPEIFSDATLANTKHSSQFIRLREARGNG
jgi:hypothetical protein